MFAEKYLQRYVRSDAGDAIRSRASRTHPCVLASPPLCGQGLGVSAFASVKPRVVFGVGMACTCIRVRAYTIYVTACAASW